MIEKKVLNAADGCKDIYNGATIMLGGFGLCGIPRCYFCLEITKMLLKDCLLGI